MLSAAKLLRAGRRLSHAEAATGSALLGKLRSVLSDAYGHVRDATPYVPFLADQIKEFPPGVPKPEVELLTDLPQVVVDVLSSPERLVRKLCPEEEEVLEDLKRRYDHFGGARKEWLRYLNSELSNGLYDFELEEVEIDKFSPKELKKNLDLASSNDVN